jgi:hypothetical protein
VVSFNMCVGTVTMCVGELLVLKFMCLPLLVLLTCILFVFSYILFVHIGVTLMTSPLTNEVQLPHRLSCTEQYSTVRIGIASQVQRIS